MTWPFLEYAITKLIPALSNDHHSYYAKYVSHRFTSYPKISFKGRQFLLSQFFLSLLPIFFFVLREFLMFVRETLLLQLGWFVLWQISEKLENYQRG